MTEGLLYKKIREIENSKFKFPKTDNKLKKVVEDMVNMNRERDVVTMEAILDKAQKEFPGNKGKNKVYVSTKNGKFWAHLATERREWFEKWFGDGE